MQTFTAVVERCPDTGLYVAHIPGIKGAHTQAESLEELNQNLQEVMALLMEEDDFQVESQFVGTQQVCVAA